MMSTVVVLERQLKIAPMRHHNNRRLPKETSWRDAYRGPHHSIGPFLRMRQSAKRVELGDQPLVRSVNLGKLVDQIGYPWIELTYNAGTQQTDVRAGRAQQQCQQYG